MGFTGLTSGQYFSRAGGPNARSWWTTFVWRPDSLPGSGDQTLFHAEISASHSWEVFFDGDDGNLKMAIVEDGSAPDVYTLFAPAADTNYGFMLWHDHVGNQVKLFYTTDGSSWTGSVTHTCDQFVSDTALTLIQLGNVDAVPSQFDNWKIGGGKPSDADGLDEVPFLNLQHTYGTHYGTFKFANGALTTDSSGNGNTLTNNGTAVHAANTAMIEGDDPDPGYQAGGGLVIGSELSFVGEGFVGADDVVSGTQEITGAGNIASGAAFGTLVADKPHIDASAIASAEAFGTAVATLTLNPSAIASGEAHGTQALQQTVNPSGIASAQAFGTTALAQHINPSAIASGEVLGTPSLAQHVNPSGIASAEAHGTGTVELSGSTLNLDPVGITSAQAFGTPFVELDILIDPSGIASAAAFGTTSLAQHVNPSGIASGEAHGTQSLAQTVNPSGIAGAEAFGQIQLVRHVNPAGIASSEAFGTLKLDFTLSPAAIASLEAFGAPVVEEFFGTPFGRPPLGASIDDDNADVALTAASAGVTLSGSTGVQLR